MQVFKVTTVLGVEITLDRDAFDDILEKHKELAVMSPSQISESLTNTDFVSLDKKDPSVFLYQKFIVGTPHGPKMCVAVVKHLNGKGFIITIYLSSKIRRGKIVWTTK